MLLETSIKIRAEEARMIFAEIRLTVLLSVFEVFSEIAFEIVDIYSDLCHAVTLSDGNGVVLERFEVDSHAVRGTDLVLTTVSLAYAACLVVGRREFLAKRAVNFFGLFSESFFCNGSTATL